MSGSAPQRAGAGGDGDLGVDDADRDAAELRQPGPVAEPLHDGQPGAAGGVGADADEEVRPGPGNLPGQRAGAEVPVGQHEHPGAEAAQQPGGVRGLSGRCRAENGVDHRAGAAGDQGHQAQERVTGPARGAPALPGVDGQVRRGVRDRHHSAVNRDRQQAPPAHPGRSRRHRGRPLQQREQAPQRLRPQPGPGLPQRPGGRPGHREPAQPGHHPVPDLGITQAREQAPGQDQVDRDPGRDIPDPALEPARLGQHRVNHLKRHLLRQLAQMTRGKTPLSHPDGTPDDRLVHCGTPVVSMSCEDTPHIPEPRSRSQPNPLTSRQTA